MAETDNIATILKTIEHSIDSRFAHLERHLEEMEKNFRAHTQEVNTLLVTGDLKEGRIGIAHEQRQLRNTVDQLQTKVDSLLATSIKQDAAVSKLIERINDLALEVDKLRADVRDAAAADQNKASWLGKELVAAFIRWFVPFILLLIGYGVWYAVTKTGAP
jgi:hypothetical protein